MGGDRSGQHGSDLDLVREVHYPLYWIGGKINIHDKRIFRTNQRDVACNAPTTKMARDPIYGSSPYRGIICIAAQ